MIQHGSIVWRIILCMACCSLSDIFSLGSYSVGRRDNDFAIISSNLVFGFLACFFGFSFFFGAGRFNSLSRFFNTDAKRSGGLGFLRGLALAKLAGAFGFGFASGFGFTLTFGFGFAFGLGSGLGSGGGGTTATSGLGAGGGGVGAGAFLTFGAGGGFGGFTSAFFSGSLGGSGADDKFVIAAIGTISTTIGISCNTGGLRIAGNP
jgi:hypothetical protein